MIAVVTWLCDGVLGVALVVVVVVFLAAVLVALLDPMTPPDVYEEPEEQPAADDLTGGAPRLPRSGRPFPTQQQRGDA